MCSGESCFINITGKVSGKDTVTISAKSDSDVNINISVTIDELEIVVLEPEKNTIIPDENLSFGNGELSISFGTSQSEYIQITEGTTTFITILIDYPRYSDEVIEVISITGNRIKIDSNILDEDVSDNNMSVFRIGITATSSGIEKLTFRIKDSDLAIYLNVTVSSTTCGVSEANYDILKSGEISSKVILGTRLGFNSVEIIYPKIETESTIGFQNFIYILEDDNNSTSHSSSATDSFSFMKFIEDLEGIEYKIKYIKDGETVLKCLDGIFPTRDIVQEEIIEEVIEEDVPTSPTE